MNISIRTGTIEDALEVQRQIPEFRDAYSKQEYCKRLVDKHHLILIAYSNGEAVGYKVGYQLQDDVFYSWMGGVLKSHRGKHVAQKLAAHQENWAKSHGFTAIRFKTRNHLKGMLIFSLKNGFDIIGVEEKAYPRADYRVILEKDL
ncbi:GNAT family N-acetyltransferase [Fulvivirga aurantia]|uniref:GNAT family N-acetyltransferase n=1 Tax=Fulvivirga aurantia TaxID=2529383 RepID=UPI0012BBEC94|nr:GNAT family N-acetyltransferase [Fulvivirga aurantia]